MADTPSKFRNKLPAPGEWSYSWSLAGKWLVYLGDSSSQTAAFTLPEEMGGEAALLTAAPDLARQLGKACGALAACAEVLQRLQQPAMADGAGEIMLEGMRLLASATTVKDPSHG